MENGNNKSGKTNWDVMQEKWPMVTDAGVRIFARALQGAIGSLITDDYCEFCSRKGECDRNKEAHGKADCDGGIHDWLMAPAEA